MVWCTRVVSLLDCWCCLQGAQVGCNRLTRRHGKKQPHRQTDRQADRQTARQRHTQKQAEGQMDRLLQRNFSSTNMLIYVYTHSANVSTRPVSQAYVSSNIV